MDKLRKMLINNPELSHKILSGDISFLTNGGDMVRLLETTNQHGYKVTVEVDDDELTPEERLKRDSELADRAIKVLMKYKGQGRF